jgi:hypothetical protein
MADLTRNCCCSFAVILVLFPSRLSASAREASFCIDSAGFNAFAALTRLLQGSHRSDGPLPTKRDKSGRSAVWVSGFETTDP